MNWVISAFMFVLTCILIYFVVSGALYIGWALGGFIGLVLAILLAMEIIEEGGFFGGIIAIIVIVLIIDFLF